MVLERVESRVTAENIKSSGEREEKLDRPLYCVVLLVMPHRLGGLRSQDITIRKHSLLQTGENILHFITIYIDIISGDFIQ